MACIARYYEVTKQPVTIMDIVDLKIFESVARLGGMSRAAVEMNTVQSNVTARIRSLEDELGLQLFHRTSQGVSLTQAGHRLLPYARRAGVLLGEAIRATRDTGTPNGNLVIGSLETTAAFRLSPLFASYVADYPGVDVSLKTGTSCELVEQVLDRRIEGAFVCGPVDHPELAVEKMFREQLVVLSARQLGSLDELLACKDIRIIVLRLGCSYRLILEAMLARRGIVNVRQMEFGTLETIIASVEAGLGITLLPKALIGPVWRAGRVAVHELPAEEARVETVFIRRQDGFESSALAAFLERARSALASGRAAA